MPLADIAALDVPAADDAVLFLWVPSSLIDDAMTAVLPAWGFEHCTTMVWTKDLWGLGNYVRHQHELVFVARRGSLPVPEPHSRPSSWVHAPRREHSQKPERFYELIEQMYPGLSKVELFARQARAGWASWGDQLGAVG
jgi:N6-adenosine-specific RNA methylase IME4